MEEMSWKQIKNALADGYKTVIIPVGSIEQHGPHLPVGTDYLLGYPISREVARRLGKTLVAPTIRPGLSEHHMHFPGTVTLQPETFKMVLRDYLSCYIRHGFTTIIFLNTHGGNAITLRAFVEENENAHPGVTIIFPRTSNASRLSNEEEGIPQGISGSHSGHAESSAMLAWYPQFVDMSAAEEGFTGEFNEEKRNIMNTVGIHGVTPNGILGDAREAHAARGIRDNMRQAKEYTEVIQGMLSPK